MTACGNAGDGNPAGYGLTSRRLWATTAALLALIGVVVGGIEMLRRITKREHPDGAWTWHRQQPVGRDG